MSRREHRPRRFFSPNSIAGQHGVRLDPDAAGHAIRVLRLRSGDAIRLFDNDGLERHAMITRIDKKQVEVALGEPVHDAVDSPLDLTLAVAMIRGERMDFIVQKTTELGIARIVPLYTERGIIRLNIDKRENRRQHWQNVARFACEQCGRRTIPCVEPITDLDGFLQSQSTGRKLVLDPQGNTVFGARESAGDTPIVFLVGPEGGLSGKETEAAIVAGFERISLGPRILRTETAAIVGTTLLQAHHGDLLQTKDPG